jgi:hypothetical protein
LSWFSLTIANFDFQLLCTEKGPINNQFFNCWTKSKQLSKKELSNIAPASIQFAIERLPCLSKCDERAVSHIRTPLKSLKLCSSSVHRPRGPPDGHRDPELRVLGKFDQQKLGGESLADSVLRKICVRITYFHFVWLNATQDMRKW